MSNLCVSRLIEERNQLKKDSIPGFKVGPLKTHDGNYDILNWEAYIPGVRGTSWDGGIYKLNLKFSKDYPLKPPKCTFNPPVFHPNIYLSGDVCLSILNEYEDWKPSISIRDILIGIQSLLNEPNLDSPAQHSAYILCQQDRMEYEKRLMIQAKNHYNLNNMSYMKRHY
ncbi:SUMO conjugating enzyme Hus5 [Piromyces finnis]|uniref:SUMO conjugating enzyme Hus5 n=1 Tax=Piromyces finnis TaxID=1754191 RepID=A0A1Y1VM11_9FUNG|nr:SUMO conjugating enzyme Hus5 [Piromyces finnis]|eukprot:ORX59185.1 SUMO conjugating enzyme Hus5 [Piromyces finnis]